MKAVTASLIVNGKIVRKSFTCLATAQEYVDDTGAHLLKVIEHRGSDNRRRSK